MPSNDVGGCFGFARVRAALLTINGLMIFLAVPVFCLSLSVLLRHDDQVKEGYLIKKNYATYASMLLASTSTVMIVTGIFGQISICLNFTKGTVVYMWTSLTFITIQLLVIGCIFVWKDHLYQMIKLDLDESLEYYQTNAVVREHWDHLQTNLACCGDEGSHTWQKLLSNHSEFDAQLTHGYGVVPVSCVNKSGQTNQTDIKCPWRHDLEDDEGTRCAVVTFDLDLHEMGCVEAVTEYLVDHINLIAYVGLAYVFAQLAAAFLAFRWRHLAAKLGIIE